MQSPLNKLSKDELIQLVSEHDARYEKAQAQHKKVQAQREAAQLEVTRLNHIIEKLRRMIFGSKRERFEGSEHAR